MIIKVYVYESKGKLCTDSYTDKEPEIDYTGCKCFKFEISETIINDQIESMVKDYDFFKRIVSTDHGVQCLSNELSHCMSTGQPYATELKDLQFIMRLKAREIIVEVNEDTYSHNVLESLNS